MAEDIDKDLITALRLAKTTPMFFAFVAKGASDGKLLMSRRKVSTGEIAEAKKEVGGGTIFTGRCVGESGELVFETPKAPPSSLAKQLKAVIRRDAGMTVKVDTRQAGSEDDE